MFWKKWSKNVVFVAALLLLSTVPTFIKSNYFLHIFIITFLSIIYTVSLRLVMQSGLLSFGHGAFVGIGAYASALLMMKVGLPFLPSMILSGIIAAVVGGLFLFPALRVRGAYFVILSWAVGEVFVVVYKRGKELFGGASGLYGIPSPEIFGVEFTSKIHYFYLALVLMAITVLVCYRVDRTRFGVLIKGISNSPDLSESVGVNLPKYKILNFSLACFFAGLGGSFLAHYVRFISPEMFGIALSESIVAYMLVGGSGSVLGAILGATILTALPEILAFASYYKMLIYGIVLILTMIFLPAGIISLPALLKKKYFLTKMQ
ncbi:MAG: branched-chain amino acid ABC transporter permease [Deltaproteobacteria bacterium]|nr:branched-chain amino acid ABC transporter permease [Deltaproteobacteria bacterium]